jgi:hypothetical protein
MMWFSLRRGLARSLVYVADWLYAPGSDREIPTIAELSHLSFDEVWSSLIAAAKLWKVSRLDLVVYRRNEPCTEYSWFERDAAASPTEHCSWSLGVAFPRNDGQRCELRATIHGSVTPAHVSLMALTRALQVFAVRFAIHAEPLAGLTLLRADEEAAPAANTCVSKAA